MVRIIAASVLGILCVAGPALSHAATLNDAAAHQAADEIMNKFQTAYNAARPAGIADLFAKDGVYLTPVGTRLTDRKDIEKVFDARFKAGWTVESIKPIEAHPAGDNVWFFGDYRIQGSGANQGKEIGGYFAQVLAKEGSDWKIRLMVGNIKPQTDVSGMAAATAGK
ncbi:nuclear transport factor 2 family protein [Pseudaminobacter sp. 19-2017]|uniref:Nuclear transport factor 2 family protein n=1 Tax=Pseudaminobacter soli (ex Zhang et al. 2022) TaxID=2831468 RepID=A0A942E0U3_9HYPH|nr:nuclear transport factor 2 family protein [Pseudaminobacter soli]MBS3651301.1 nuclear transport factor 2 family protein [Pseudaminobacter soli]